MNGGNIMSVSIKVEQIHELLNKSSAIRFTIQDINLENGTVKIFVPNSLDAVDMILQFTFGV